MFLAFRGVFQGIFFAGFGYPFGYPIGYPICFCVNFCLLSGLFLVGFGLAAAGGAGWLSASCGYAVLCGCTAFFVPFPGGFGVYE